MAEDCGQTVSGTKAVLGFEPSWILSISTWGDATGARVAGAKRLESRPGAGRAVREAICVRRAHPTQVSGCPCARCAYSWPPSADPPIDCKSHCQGHTKESRRAEATIVARATAHPPIDCKAQCQGHTNESRNPNLKSSPISKYLRPVVSLRW